MHKLIKGKAFWIVVVIVSFSLGLISFTSPNRQSSTIIEKTIRDIYTPLQSGVNGVFGFFRGFGSFFTEKQGLIQKVKDLEAENDRLKLENQALREETDELLRLRSLVNFTDTHDQMFSFTAARVIARSPNNWCKILTINRGSEHGIRKDMAVISPDGLVGRIGSVSQKSSQVYLITDREVAVGAILQRTRETSGIVEGKGESYQLWMKNIPYYSDIRKGDRVITSGLSEYYPKGILIGTVKQTKKEPGGLLLSAIITPGVDFSKLEEVLVVTNYIPPAVNITVDQEEQ